MAGKKNRKDNLKKQTCIDSWLKYLEYVVTKQLIDVQYKDEIEVTKHIQIHRTSSGYCVTCAPILYLDLRDAAPDLED